MKKNKCFLQTKLKKHTISFDKIMAEMYVPEDVVEEAKAAIDNLLPSKSRLLYEKEYGNFCTWRKNRNVKGISEEVLLSYFVEKSKKCKASTLWSWYSMLKSTLLIKENVDISKFAHLKAFLKREYSKFEPVKSNVLEREHINKFLKEAPDKIYLMVKVALCVGVAGGCRMDELHKMKTDDIEDRGNVLIIQVPETKTNKKRKFTIVDDNENTADTAINLYRKYAALRPENTPTRSFFLAYRNERCTRQVVGINTFYKMPRMIATFLKLPSPERYTGHCFRRSSATLLADAGADTLMMKRHGGWKSTSVVEGYIEESIENKKEICNMILKGASSATVTNEVTNKCEEITNVLPGGSETVIMEKEHEDVSVTRQMFKDCTFTIYVGKSHNM